MTGERLPPAVALFESGECWRVKEEEKKRMRMGEGMAETGGEMPLQGGSGCVSGVGGRKQKRNFENRAAVNNGTA